MTDPTDAPSPPPSALEQLGAVGSLLIHDLANLMCIISGNATFAQMKREDPEGLTKALDAIAQASDRISMMLGQCSDLRRRLGSSIERGDAAAVVRGLAAWLGRLPGWRLEVEGSMGGALVMPTGWVEFAVRQVWAAAAAEQGRVRVRVARPEHDTTFIPGGVNHLEIRLQWAGAKGLSLADVRARYEDFGLLGAFELLRQCGGSMEVFPLGDARQEALLLVPFTP